MAEGLARLSLFYFIQSMTNSTVAAPSLRLSIPHVKGKTYQGPKLPATVLKPYAKLPEVVTRRFVGNKPAIPSKLEWGNWMECERQRCFP